MNARCNELYLMSFYKQVFNGRKFMFGKYSFICFTLEDTCLCTNDWLAFCEWATALSQSRRLPSVICGPSTTFCLLTWQFPQVLISDWWDHMKGRIRPGVGGKNPWNSCHTIWLQMPFSQSFLNKWLFVPFASYIHIVSCNY